LELKLEGRGKGRENTIRRHHWGGSEGYKFGERRFALQKGDFKKCGKKVNFGDLFTSFTRGPITIWAKNYDKFKNNRTSRIPPYVTAEGRLDGIAS